MKKWIFGLLALLVISTGLAFPALQERQIETVHYELVLDQGVEMPDQSEDVLTEQHITKSADFDYRSNIKNRATKREPGWVNESTLKVPVYSVPLPNENKIVLVKDPKDFVTRAIRHDMEYLAIKPGKGKYWELMPVFVNEGGALSFSLNKDQDGEDPEEEPLRIVPVKDFLRYN